MSIFLKFHPFKFVSNCDQLYLWLHKDSLYFLQMQKLTQLAQVRLLGTDTNSGIDIVDTSSCKFHPSFSFGSM